MIGGFFAGFVLAQLAVRLGVFTGETVQRANTMLNRDRTAALLLKYHDAIVAMIEAEKQAESVPTYSNSNTPK